MQWITYFVVCLLVAKYFEASFKHRYGLLDSVDKLMVFVFAVGLATLVMYAADYIVTEYTEQELVPEEKVRLDLIEKNGRQVFLVVDNGKIECKFKDFFGSSIHEISHDKCKISFDCQGEPYVEILTYQAKNRFFRLFQTFYQKHFYHFCVPKERVLEYN